jgi:hypothetical protein
MVVRVAVAWASGGGDPLVALPVGVALTTMVHSAYRWRAYGARSPRLAPIRGGIRASYRPCSCECSCRRCGAHWSRRSTWASGSS